MDLTTLRNYCMSKKMAVETFPFDDVTCAYKVHGKMFALSNLSWENSAVNLKCDPDFAIVLRDQYTGVIPGYHMNKVHWNTVYIAQDVPDDEIFSLVDHSYKLVVKSLKKALRQALETS